MELVLNLRTEVPLTFLNFETALPEHCSCKPSHPDGPMQLHTAPAKLQVSAPSEEFGPVLKLIYTSYTASDYIYV